MLAGVICPESSSTSGHKVKWSDCLSKNCSGCYPYVVRKAMYDSVEERGRWFSPSSLIFCLRKAKWQLELDYYIPISNAYWFMRGHLLHRILEDSADEDTVTEELIEREIEGITLKGKIDYYSKGVLIDYKTMIDSGFNFIKNNGIKESHIMQANIYKWIMEPKYDVKDIKIVYVGMGNCITTGQNNFIKKWNKTEVFKVPKCPVYTNSKIKNYLSDRVRSVVDLDKPPADPSNKWMCGVCPFKDRCHDI